MRAREVPIVALLLIATSALLFALHYAIFRDAHLIFVYGLHALAFLPLEVLVVTLIIDRLLSSREQQERQRKMNMVIGAFYSAVGAPLLRLLTGLATDRSSIEAHAAIDAAWSEERIRQAAAWARAGRFSLGSDLTTLTAVRDLLGGHREFLLRLLENPMLLEHEAFSELLWAAFHLQEELCARPRLEALPSTDVAHLQADAERAYGHLLAQWLDYMVHLRESYPFLFSFAARTNPLREEASAEVT